MGVCKSNKKDEQSRLKWLKSDYMWLNGQVHAVFSQNHSAREVVNCTNVFPTGTRLWDMPLGKEHANRSGRKGARWVSPGHPESHWSWSWPVNQLIFVIPTTNIWLIAANYICIIYKYVIYYIIYIIYYILYVIYYILYIIYYMLYIIYFIIYIIYYILYIIYNI